MRRSVAVLTGWAIALVAAVPALADPVGAYTEYGAGITPNSYPNAIVTGPDGNLWFTEFVGSRIGRITPDGVVTEFPTPTPNRAPNGIAAGPDGNVWFTEVGGGGRIGRITPAGVITEFPVPTPNASPASIALGPDGNLWFTETTADKIGRITPLGAITEFDAGITAGSDPAAITAGPDGNLWFTETAAAHAAVARITTAGVVTEFLTPTPDSLPTAIVTGPDGNLWVPEKRVGKIARVTPAGVITELPTPGLQPNAIALGPDGNLWMALQSGRVARVTTAGVVTQFLTGTAQGLFGMTLGPDQHLWFTEYFEQRIGRMNALADPAPTPPACRATVTGIEPAFGPPGTEVTIRGTGFGCATGVRFGDVPAAGFAIGGFDRITARAPEHALGDVDVRVVTAAGASPIVAADRFTFAATGDLLTAPDLAAPPAPPARRLTCARVPTLTGATLGAARRILARDGCAVGLTVTGQRPRRGHRRVTAQTPRPGTPLYEGDRAPAVRFG